MAPPTVGARGEAPAKPGEMTGRPCELANALGSSGAQQAAFLPAITHARRAALEHVHLLVRRTHTDSVSPELHWP